MARTKKEAPKVNQLIAAAVEPLRLAAMDRAEEMKRASIAKGIEALAALDNIIPEVPSFSKIGYEAARRLRDVNSFYASFTVYDNSRRKGYAPRQPHYVKVDAARIEARVQQAREATSLSFDGYVAKLSQKLTAGDPAPAEVTRAMIDGKHLWHGSTLTVGRADGTTEAWYTQQILNCSVLGNLFNQWPTRKLKPSKK